MIDYSHECDLGASRKLYYVGFKVFFVTYCMNLCDVKYDCVNGPALLNLRISVELIVNDKCKVFLF